MPSRRKIVHDLYRAFASGDRQVIERTFADEFTFSSPLDVGLDRAGYFNRCWPGAGQGQQFNFVRTVEAGDEVIVTYEVTNVVAAGDETPKSSPLAATEFVPSKSTLDGPFLRNVPDGALDKLCQLIRYLMASQLYRFLRPFTETSYTVFWNGRSLLRFWTGTIRQTVSRPT